MTVNRSAPTAVVVPVLVYEDVERAVAFLVRAKANGARIIEEPHDMPFGERQYTARTPVDIGGRFPSTLPASRPVRGGHGGRRRCARRLTQRCSRRETRKFPERLNVSENTVKTHSRRVFDKLSARGRPQAVQHAKEAGLVP
jgi:hypothetical protein